MKDIHVEYGGYSQWFDVTKALKGYADFKKVNVKCYMYNELHVQSVPSDL